MPKKQTRERKAGVKPQRAKARTARPGKLEIPDQVWLNVETGRYYSDFAQGAPGTQVAIFSRVAEGKIELAYPESKKRSRKRR